MDFQKEIEKLQEKFRLLKKTTILTLEQINSLFENFKLKRKDLEYLILKTPANRREPLLRMLNTIYQEKEKNPFFIKLKAAKSQLEARGQLLASPFEAKPALPHIKKKSLAAKAAKALLCGLAAVALVALAITLWGLAAELTVAVTIGALGGAYGLSWIGAGAFFAGMGSYFTWHSKCMKPLHLPPSPTMSESRRLLLTPSPNFSEDKDDMRVKYELFPQRKKIAPKTSPLALHLRPSMN